MAFGTGKIWMNGKLVEWKDAKIHVASHVIHYGTRRLRRRALLRDAEGLGLLPPRRAHRPAARLREDLPHGLAARPATAGENADPRDDPRERAEGVLHPAADVSRLRPAGRQPAALPGRRGRSGLGMGRLPRRRRAREGRGRVRQLVEPHGAEHVPGAGQGDGELRQLRADQDGGDARRLRRGHRARHDGLRQRRQRPEHVHRAQRT